MKYPIPSYAVNLWVAGDHLMVAFPGQGPQAVGHTLRLPVSAGSLKTLISVLREREHAEDLRLEHRGTPSQYHVETDEKYKAWLKAMATGQAKTKVEYDEAMDLLKEIGL